jgi:hypothetical protein
LTPQPALIALPPPALPVQCSIVPKQELFPLLASLVLLQQEITDGNPKLEPHHTTSCV